MTKVILDTNIWVSFLIGKSLNGLVDKMANNEIVVVFCPELLEELQLVCARPKFRKYFPEKQVQELITLLQIIGEQFELIPKHTVCRDPKDNFLLDLIDASHADYLVTSDADLLELNPFMGTEIISVKVFTEKAL